MGPNKPHNLKIGSDVSLSRFVVDLKKGFLEKEISQNKINKPRNIEEKFEKLAEISYKKIINRSKEKVKSNFTALSKIVSGKNLLITALPQLRPEQAAETIKKKRLSKKKEAGIAIKAGPNNYLAVLSNQLALIGLGKILFVLFYKICYFTGWLIMFNLRLAYFLFLIITGPIIKNLKFLFVKFKFNPRGILNILGSRLKAKRNIIPSDSLPAMPVKRISGYLKPILIFAGLLLTIILPVKAFTYYKVIGAVKGKVLGVSENALDSLISAGQSAASFNFSQAGQGFASASDNFLKAQNELKEINGLLLALAALAPDKNIRLAAAGKNILRAGELSANAGKNLSLAMASLFNYKTDKTESVLENLSFYGHSGLADLSELEKILNQIDSGAIPDNYQKDFILLKQKVSGLNRGLKEFISLADTLKNFLGLSADKRYLLIFQNNSELRASGGFIGSFALIDFSKGEIKNIETPGGGSYDTEAGFLKKIKPPQPLSLVRPDWHFWDANWWPDWPTSARKLAWFYENSDGSTVDGVISLTPAVIEKLLRIIGPIDLKDKYGLVIDADNFWLETQKLAERKPDITRQPKKIIGDLMNEIIKEAPKRLSQDNLLPLFKTLEELLAGKNILFYFADQELAAKADDLDWSGRIKNTAGDYLNVINSNIAGGKSDRKIRQEIIHQAKVQPDGSIIDNLIIRRFHEAIKREPFSGVRNVNWVRVYVPLGSELLAVNGFRPVDKIFFSKEIPGLSNDPDVEAAEGRAITHEPSGTKIYDEFGKTVFANWSQLDPGETAEINIKYRLPFKLTDKKEPVNAGFTDQLVKKAAEVLSFEQKKLYSYSLLAQKQPGMNSSVIESQLELSRGYQPVWKYPAGPEDELNGWVIRQNLDQDKIMAIIAEEK